MSVKICCFPNKNGVLKPRSKHPRRLEMITFIIWLKTATHCKNIGVLGIDISR